MIRSGKRSEFGAGTPLSAIPLTSFVRTISKARKTALFLFSVAVLLAGGAAPARGQSALDGFDPNANGPVLVVVVQPDGKILIGGDFTTLSPNGGATVTRNHIARLNPDGTLDTAFNPNANGTVYCNRGAGGRQDFGGRLFNGRIASADRRAISSPGSMPPPDWLIRSTRTRTVTVFAIAVQADGKILAGGFFTSIGGQTRNRIARLDAMTGSADSFDPNANDVVYSIAVQADGKILAGGDFTSIGGQSRNHIARLDATTGLADSFDPNANGHCPLQSRCRRTARFWWAAVSRTSADRRAIASPGSMP